MPNPLTTRQDNLPGMKLPELEKLEAQVHKGLRSFIETGQALIAIREKRGYLLRNFKDFDSYCQATFGFGERQGLRLMAGYETAQQVKKVTGETPRNEYAMRALQPVASDPKLVQKVADMLKRKGETIATATHERIQEVVDKVKPQTKPMFGEDRPPTAAERAAAPILKSLNDACPKCHSVPIAYNRDEDGWHCGDCHAPVRVSAVAVEIVQCKECRSPILDDSGFCQKCGAIQ